jgi:hypothetical protein
VLRTIPQHRFVYGVRLVLLTDGRGLPLGYTIVPANEKELSSQRAGSGSV